MVAASVATSAESMRRGRGMSTGKISVDASGPAREQHDAIAEPHCFAHVVRDEQNGRAGRAPQGLELVVEPVARHGVERAEGLVHQQDFGVLRERAGERDALAHAARQLVRALLGELPEVDHREQLVGARGALALFGVPASFNASSTLPRAVNHGNNADSWNIKPVCSASTVISPAVGRSRPAIRLSSVLLPQPEAPSRQTNSPGATSRLTRSSAATPDWP